VVVVGGKDQMDHKAGGAGNTPPVSPPQGNSGGKELQEVLHYRWRRWRRFFSSRTKFFRSYCR
jgi:hypothetical protein